MNLSTLEETTLATFKSHLASRFGKRLVAVKLFGSRARGEGNEESDLDLLILVNELSRNEKSEILDLACDFWLDTGVCISPLVMATGHFQMIEGRERLLAKEIQRDGVLL